MTSSLGRKGGRYTKIGLASGVSVAALLLGSGHAAAQCVPSPAQGTSVTACTGTEANGLNVTGNATVNLPAGATILAPNPGASAIRASSAIAGADPNFNFPNLNLDGAVIGGASGISIDSRTATSFSFGPSINPRINVGATGSVTGVVGIELIGNLANPQYHATQASVVNRGVITGSGGFALLATNPERAYFQSVENLAGGQIGAIKAFVAQITNAGTIDGGANSAYSYVINPVFGPSVTITNSGTITSASSSATIVLGTQSPGGFGLPITNTGTISNTGAGKAIVTTSLLQLTNRGTITGTIDASASNPSLFPPWSLGHRIDNSGGGIINGSVLFGAGRDTLIVDFGTPGNPIGGISGSVDGGAGSDLLQLTLTGDTVLSSPVAAVPTFETVAFSMPYGKVLTLAPGFTASNGVLFADAPGTVVNNAVLVTNGSAIARVPGKTGPSVVNNGAITATIPASPQPFFDVAVRPGDYASLNNTGSITAIGGRGVDLNSGELINSGSITATGIAVSIFNGGLSNSGLIESTGGIGLAFSGSIGVRGTSTGTIRGATAGVRLGARLDNSGTIESANTGIELEFYGVVNNKAGGTISGGVKAIAAGTAGAVVGGSVDNAGTINGDVDFGTFFNASYNRFTARAGSTVNGNLHLGSGGDTLVAQFGGSDPLGGVTGTITGNGYETLHYLVATDATTQVAAPGVFDAIVYDLNDATLNLTTAAPLTLGLGFAGKGTVNFSGTISGTTTTHDDLIGLDLRRTSLHVGSDGLPLRGLNVVNSGSISRTRGSTNAGESAAVWLSGLGSPGSGASFTNTGTITVLDTGPAIPGFVGLTGIRANGAVTNSGLIQVGGAVGVMGAGDRLTLTNSGSILQLSGQPAGRGVVGVELLTNTGTISTGGDAVTIGTGFSGFASRVVNSGTIASSGGYGVRTNSFGWISTVTNEAGGSISGAVVGVLAGNGVLTNSGSIASAGTGVVLGQGGTVDNRAGGTISGTTLAIARDLTQMGFFPGGGATIRNAGAINGNVDLGTGASPTRNTFFALERGVVNGNLHLGSGDDTLVVHYGATGPLGGVTGAITGSGSQTLRYLIDADAGVTLETASIFNTIGFDLAGDATVTATASGPQAMNVEFAGVGTVDLTADITGNAARPTLNLTATSVQLAGDPPAVPQTKLSVTSRGSLSATADVSTPTISTFPMPSVSPVVATRNGNSFTNEGTITARNLAFASRSMAAIGGGGTVVNNGTISLDGAIGIQAGSTLGVASILAVRNGGSILQQGAVSRGIVDALSLDNSGTIRTEGTAVTLAGSGLASGLREVTNTGTIESTGGSGIEYLDIYAPASITNAAGGVITGSTSAISLAYGRLDNSGTINGLVSLSSSLSGVAFTNRGTVNGDVLFGQGGDILTVFDGSTITGAIDGGAGFDTYVRAFTASANIDLGTGVAGITNFERLGVSAIGADTTVTLSDAAGVNAGGALFDGSGTIVSDVNFAVSAGDPPPFFGQPRANAVILGTVPSFGTQPGPQGAVAVVNRGVMGDGASGLARSFENTGTIGSGAIVGTVLHLSTGSDGTFSLLNSGSILTKTAAVWPLENPFAPAVQIDPLFNWPAGESASIRNEGTIDGGLWAGLRFGNIDFANSGTITERTIAFPDGQGAVAAVSLGVHGGILPEDSNADRVSFDNSGRIIGGSTIAGAINHLSVVNTGEMGEIGIYTYSHYLGPDAEPIDQTLVAFDNSGSIGGTVTIDARSSVDFTNSGSIVTENAASGPGSVEITVDTLASSTIAFANSGTISASAPEVSGVVIGALSLSLAARGAGFDPAVPAVADAPGVDIAFTNSGTITANGGARYTPSYTFPAYPADIRVPAQLGITTGVSLAAAGEGETSVAITNAASGVISANGAMTAVAGEVPVELQGLGSIALAAMADRVTIVNEGTITGNAGGTLSSDVTVNAFGTNLVGLSYMAGAIQTFGSIDTLTNATTGAITGSIDLGDFDDFVVNRGRINGDLFLRAGNDSLLHALSGTITGIADGGEGIDRLTIDLTGDGILDLSQFLSFEDVSFVGSGALGSNGPLALDTVLLAGGDLQIAAGQTLATAGPNTVTGTATSEHLGNAGTIAGTVTLLAGDDAVDNRGMIAGSVLLGAGNDRLVNTGSIGGAVDLGDGNDVFTGGGTVAGLVQMGAGDDIADFPALTGAAGGMDGGAGIDLLQISAAANSTTNITPADAGRLVNFETIQATGPGTINASGTFAVNSFVIDGSTVNVATGTSFRISGGTAITGGASAERILNGGTLTGNLDLGGGDNQIDNLGTIAGNVLTGSGNDTFANGGTVNGSVNLGGGTNTVVLQDGGRFTGPVAAGSGTSDLLRILTAGTYQAPFQFDGSNFTGFETLLNAGGATRLTGSFVGNVDVSGGYLFGTQGSTIIGNVGVTTGAQFGTAGTVNGNVTIGAGGTLAPGSSPGIMTVNGNVSLAAGSISVFEFVPAPGQSDQLLISGSLTIAANTTLTMTGTRPLTPGVNYDIIVANGGISGTFATVNQPATIDGFLRYTTTRLQLMGTFLAPAGLTPQQTAAVDFVNSVLIDGTGNAALFAAVPLLLTTDGMANGAAFNLLTPEPYATASQLGISNALAVVQAGRSGIARSTRDNAGAFAFAHGLGAWRTFTGNAALGTSRAESDTWGILSGIGYGTAGASLGAFVGRLDGEQDIGALSAETEANGTIAGVAGHFQTGAFELNVLAAYDWSEANTDRTVPGGRVSSSEYSLNNLVLDASVGYRISAGADWTVRPEVGISHASGSRGSARESGNAAFALDIDRDEFSATFIDGSIALEGGQHEGAAFHPWLSVGVRHQIEGGFETATAGFSGGTSRFTVMGAGRDETVMTAGAGVAYDIGMATLYAAYQGEFGGGNSHNGSVGVQIKF